MKHLFFILFHSLIITPPLGSLFPSPSPLLPYISSFLFIILLKHPLYRTQNFSTTTTITYYYLLQLFLIYSYPPPTFFYKKYFYHYYYYLLPRFAKPSFPFHACIFLPFPNLQNYSIPSQHIPPTSPYFFLLLPVSSSPINPSFVPFNDTIFLFFICIAYFCQKCQYFSVMTISF